MARAAIISNRRITGLSADVLAELVAEIGPLWHARRQAKLASRARKRAVGAGAKHQLVFVDGLLGTLSHLRHAATYDVLACWFQVDRPTITRVIGEIGPLLAERGCTVGPGLRLRTLAEVVEHLGAKAAMGIIDGTEIRVRRPKAGSKDLDAFISGKSRQDAVKAMVVSDQDGRVLFCSPTVPGSCADIHPRPSIGTGPAAGRRAGTLLAAHPDRTRHRAPEELALARTTPRTPRAHEPHHPSRRRPAIPPADRERDIGSSGVSRIHTGQLRLTAYRAQGR